MSTCNICTLIPCAIPTTATHSRSSPFLAEVTLTLEKSRGPDSTGNGPDSLDSRLGIETPEPICWQAREQLSAQHQGKRETGEMVDRQVPWHPCTGVSTRPTLQGGTVILSPQQ